MSRCRTRPPFRLRTCIASCGHRAPRSHPTKRCLPADSRLHLALAPDRVVGTRARSMVPHMHRHHGCTGQDIRNQTSRCNQWQGAFSLTPSLITRCAPRNSYARGCVRRRGARRFGGHTKRTETIAKDGHMVEAISTGVQERGQDRTWTVVQPVRRRGAER